MFPDLSMLLQLKQITDTLQAASPDSMEPPRVPDAANSSDATTHAKDQQMVQVASTLS